MAPRFVVIAAIIVLFGGGAVCDAGRPPPPPPSSLPVMVNATFSDNMVLQKAPAKAAVYGTVPTGATVQLTVTSNTDGRTITASPIPATVTGGNWKAFLPPMPDGGDFDITVSCISGCVNKTNALLKSVTFGDVWYCSGQSNMWLPLHYTFSRNLTIANITGGKLDNIRLMAGNSQQGVTHPWMTAKQAISNGNASVPVYSLFDFSAACWYFAESLTLQMVAAGEKPPTFGLINTAIGGSMIESWLPNNTLHTCKNVSLGPNNEYLYEKNVVPYLNMTMKGFLWYQGENDMHQVKGNSLDHVGYGCEMAALVEIWRKLFSVEPGTTDPNAPFGVVILPDSGSEGGRNMGAMRWAQTGNYGVLPNKLMGNTFLAQAYDLNDPWGDKTCYEWGCCGGNATKCAESATKQNLPKDVCATYCHILQSTPVFMGGIHPRLKKPVGERLASVAHNLVYGGKGPVAGPTLAGCSISGNTLTVSMDKTLLAGTEVKVRPDYYKNLSTFEVLTNPQCYCIEEALRCQLLPNGTRPDRCGSRQQEWYCPADLSKNCTIMREGGAAGYDGEDYFKLGGVPPRSPFDHAWMQLPVAAASGRTDAITVDLSSLNGTKPVAIRYAWHGDCCKQPDPHIGKSVPCKPKNCPIVSSEGLPGNPFFAQIEGGKCKCTAPQTCDQ